MPGGFVAGLQMLGISKSILFLGKCGSEDDSSRVLCGETDCRFWENRMSLRPRGIDLSTLMLTTVSLFWGTLAYAGDWELTDSISYGATAIQRNSDSVSDSDWMVFSVQPSFELKGKGGRISGNVKYGLDLAYDTGDSGEKLAHSLRASLSSQVYEDFFFLNASAFAGLTTRAATSASADALSPDSETSQSYALTLSPVFQERLGRFAKIVSRNRLGLTGSDDDGQDDAVSRTLHIGLESGREFARMNWFAAYTDRYTDFSTRDETVSSFDVGLGYRLDRVWRLNAGIGYAENDAPTLRSSNSGMTWNIGTNWTPTPRTKGFVSFGENYWGEAWSGAISHVSRKTRVSARFSRTLSNTSSLLAENINGSIFNPDGTPVRDTDGELLVAPTQQLTQTNENFINTSVGADIKVTGRRTSVIGSITYQEREFDVSGEKDETISYRLQGSRSLTGKTTLKASIGYSDFSSTNEPADDTLDLSLGVSRQLGRFSTLGVSLAHRIFDSEVGTDYDEQRLSVTFATKIF